MHRLTLSVFACFLSMLSGCVESTFRLADDSRFPRWFATFDRDQGSRGVVTLTYLTPSKTEPDAVLELRTPDGHVQKVEGQACWHPAMLDSGNHVASNRYPKYQYFKRDGVVEVIEHRKLEPLFRVVDDERLTRAAETSAQCVKE